MRAQVRDAEEVIRDITRYVADSGSVWLFVRVVSRLEGYEKSYGPLWDGPLARLSGRSAAIENERRYNDRATARR